MKFFLSLLMLMFFSFQGLSLEKLSGDYLTTFGDPESKVKITQYFSFSCPYCLRLFREDFQGINEKYLESGKACCVFHPVPMGRLTVQAMDCLEKLSEKDKRNFLKAILEWMPIDDDSLSVRYMQKAMEIFKKPVPDLNEKDYLSQTRAIHDAFRFIKQSEKIDAVPCVEINEQLFLDEVPSRAFIEKYIQNIITQPLDLEEGKA